METSTAIWVFSTLFGTVEVLLIGVLIGMSRQMNEWKFRLNSLFNHQSIPIKSDGKRIAELSKEFSNLSLESKLETLKGLFGTNYKAIIRVVDGHVEFEGVGEYPIETHDSKTFG